MKKIIILVSACVVSCSTIGPPARLPADREKLDQSKSEPKTVLYSVIINKAGNSTVIAQGRFTRRDYESFFSTNYPLAGGGFISPPDNARVVGAILIFAPSISRSRRNQDPYFGAFGSEPLLLTIYSWPYGMGRRFLLTGNINEKLVGLRPLYYKYGPNLDRIIKQFQKDMLIGHKGASRFNLVP
jgi:hypothetical protein